MKIIIPKYSKVTTLSAQSLIAVLSIVVIIVFSDPSTLTFAQSDAPENRPPVIVVESPIVGQINQTVIINASISDPDGNITTIIWNQESEGPAVTMDISEDKQSMSFIPAQNITYVFSVEGIDNSGAATLESVQVRVGSR